MHGEADETRLPFRGATSMIYIYSTRGNGVGFHLGRFVYDLTGNPVGQLNGSNVHTLHGEYVGELFLDMVVDQGVARPGNIGVASSPANAGPMPQPHYRGPQERNHPDMWAKLAPPR